ncbi:MAG TPA: serine/threonine-protein kinase [Fimbriiglobus sp.]|jgi:serine/threonine protein kinase
MTSLPADADTDLANFARSLEQSRLVRTDDVARLFTGQVSAADAANHLVTTGTLTRYQADKLLTGRWQGLVLGPYRILHPAGRGGMGLVYRAAKEGAAEPVALKILPPKRAEERPQTLSRFKREMRIGRIVPPHPNVVATVDSGVIDGVYFLAMEYVPGPTLKQRVAKLGAMPVETVAHLFTRAATGLAAVHSAGVVHRDVSPGNLILTPAGDVKLLDFGVAIVAGEPLPADPTVAGGKGYTMGTMDYIAPEQVRDAAAATFASDLYALGCSLYFALTGTPPYPGGDSRQKIRWHKRAEAPPVNAINPLVPAELSYLVERLMAKSPADRPDSAIAVAHELLSFAPAEEWPDPIGHAIEAWDSKLDPSDEGEVEEWPVELPRPFGAVRTLIVLLVLLLGGLIVLLVLLVIKQR